MSIDLSAISYTPTIISNQLIQDLSVDQNQQAQLEQQLSTGVLVNQPSDNPAAASSIMLLNSSVSRAQQYASNATDGLGWLSLANSTVNSVISNLQSVQQLVLSISGSQLAGQQSAISGIGNQLQGLSNQILALANTAYGGQAIFAGTGNVSQAYDANGNYLGGGSAPTRTVAPGVTVPVSVTGDQVFGNLLGPNGALTKLVSDVQSNTSSSLQAAQTTDIQNLNTAIQTVTAAAASLGSDYQRMQGFSTQATNAQTALQSQLSSEDTVDVAQASTQLTEAQQTYQSGLWATAQIESHSLVSYL